MKDKLVKKYVELIRSECDTGDTEFGHMKADYLLCQLLYELGYEEVIKEYDKVSKWYA